MAESEVLTEVPEDLKRLVRIIMRAFYDVEFAIVMDKLIHHPCIKEEELLDLVRFERKQLRAIMTKLKEEKVTAFLCIIFASYYHCNITGFYYLFGNQKSKKKLMNFLAGV